MLVAMPRIFRDGISFEIKVAISGTYRTVSHSSDETGIIFDQINPPAAQNAYEFTIAPPTKFRLPLLTLRERSGVMRHTGMRQQLIAHQNRLQQRKVLTALIKVRDHIIEGEIVQRASCRNDHGIWKHFFY